MATPLVRVADGTAQMTLASAYTAGSGTFTLTAAPGFTATAAQPVSMSLIDPATYAQGGSEVQTAYEITGVSGNTCTIGGVLFGTDRNYAAGAYAESRVGAPSINGVQSILQYSASTAGQVLTSTGAASPPTWQAPQGGGAAGSGTVAQGTAGQLAYYPAAGTTVQGLSLDSSLSITGGTLGVAGGGSASGALMGILVNATAITGVATPTGLTTGGTIFGGSITIAANTLTRGAVVALRLGGNYTNPGGATTAFSLRIKFGTAVMLTATLPPLSTTTVARPWMADAFFCVHNPGVSGTVLGFGSIRFAADSPTGTDATASFRPGAGTAWASAILNSTVDATIMPEGSWAATTANVSVQLNDLAWWLHFPA